MRIDDTGKRILVLGATGLIGQALLRALLRDNYEIAAIARAESAITRSLPQVRWIFCDMADLRTAHDWFSFLEGCAAVVNLAGALQESSRDRLTDVHAAAIAALAAACPRACRLVHVSAPGARLAASTEFHRTKALGDAAVKAGGCDWIILRPGVVLARDAYGGSALLRALAAFPGFIPAFRPDSVIQTIAMDDVVDAICMAIEGKLPPATDVVLSEPNRHTLADVLLALRQWLGLSPAPIISVPLPLARAVSFCADITGYLGWRSPLRTTALAVAAEGVTANSADWTRLTGRRCKSLEESLALIPATVQERWFARLYLLKPLIIVVLALFWFLSGVVGLLQIEWAAAPFIAAGLDASMAKIAITIGTAVDMALGALVIHRRSMRFALVGMILVASFYLVMATILVPALWLDPLGALLKVFPVMILALVALAIGPER